MPHEEDKMYVDNIYRTLPILVFPDTVLIYTLQVTMQSPFVAAVKSVNFCIHLARWEGHRKGEAANRHSEQLCSLPCEYVSERQSLKKLDSAGTFLSPDMELRDLFEYFKLKVEAEKGVQKLRRDSIE
jgi:hypothetical protein